MRSIRKALIGVAASKGWNSCRRKDGARVRSAHRRELRGEINQRIAVVARHLPDVASAKPAAAPGPAPVEHPKKRPKLRTYLEDDR